MSLIIDNYKFGQTINFSLPLIEGRAPDLCCRIHSIHSKCESDCTSWVICMHNDGQSSRSFIISGRFQLLISLKRGRNQMQFQYSKCAQSVVPFEICFEPIESQFRVQLVYITCPSKDDAAELFEKGRFQSPPHIRSDAEAATIKLGLAARMLQTFFAQSRCRHHFARNTFSLKSDHNGQPLVEIIKLNEPIDRLYSLCEQDLWTLVAKHLIQSTNDRKVKYLGICSFSRYSSDSNLNEDQLNQLDYEELIGRVRGFVCMGGGQLALMGSCSLFTWPSHFNQVSKRFNDSTPIDRRKWFDDSGSNS